jgi:hypothetical protein
MNSMTFIVESGDHHACAEFASLEPSCLGSRDEIERSFRDADRESIWIVLKANVFPLIASAALPHASIGGSGLLLTFASIPVAFSYLFQQRFKRIAQSMDKMLSNSELAAVLSREDRADFCIGGSIVPRAGFVTLLRGDLSTMNVSLSCFPASGKGLKPDPSQFDVVDHGHTLKFGEYEAPFDTVLYELDRAYRQRLRKQRLAEDATFGGALRRLRLQKRKKLSDMTGIEKAVARIERGEVLKPQKRTLERIGELLGVPPDEIGEY